METNFQTGKNAGATRRDFLQKTALIALSAVFSPNVLLAAMRRRKDNLGVALVGLGYYSTDVSPAVVRVHQSLPPRGHCDGHAVESRSLAEAPQPARQKHLQLPEFRPARQQPRHRRGVRGAAAFDAPRVRRTRRESRQAGLVRKTDGPDRRRLRSDDCRLPGKTR